MQKENGRSNHEAIRLHHWGYTAEGIAHELGIKKESVLRALQRAGIKKKTNKKWTTEDINTLLDLYNRNPRAYAEQASKLLKRTTRACLMKMEKLRRKDYGLQTRKTNKL
jgi:hypothetical protein